MHILVERTVPLYQQVMNSIPDAAQRPQPQHRQKEKEAYSDCIVNAKMCTHCVDSVEVACPAVQFYSCNEPHIRKPNVIEKLMLHTMHCACRFDVRRIPDPTCRGEQDYLLLVFSFRKHAGPTFVWKGLFDSVLKQTIHRVEYGIDTAVQVCLCTHVPYLACMLVRIVHSYADACMLDSCVYTCSLCDLQGFLLRRHRNQAYVFFFMPSSKDMQIHKDVF